MKSVKWLEGYVTMQRHLGAMRRKPVTKTILSRKPGMLGENGNALATIIAALIIENCAIFTALFT